MATMERLAVALTECHATSNGSDTDSPSSADAPKWQMFYFEGWGEVSGATGVC